MPLFYNKKKPKVVKAYKLEGCPHPVEEWSETPINYSNLVIESVNTDLEDSLELEEDLIDTEEQETEETKAIVKDPIVVS